MFLGDPLPSECKTIQVSGLSVKTTADLMMQQLGKVLVDGEVQIISFKLLQIGWYGSTEL